MLSVARNIGTGAQVEQPAGMSPNADGGVAGSSTQRVSATPEPPSSAALTETPTGPVYQPLFPFGTAGDRLIVVTGAAESRELNSAEMFRRTPLFEEPRGARSAPTAGRVSESPNDSASPPAPVALATMAVPFGS